LFSNKCTFGLIHYMDFATPKLMYTGIGHRISRSLATYQVLKKKNNFVKIMSYFETNSDFFLTQ